MTCDLFQIEIYKQRPGEDLPASHEFQEHLQTCPACAHKLAAMVEQDAAIRQTIQHTDIPLNLANMVRSGIRAERSTSQAARTLFPHWMNLVLLPAAALLLIVVVMTLQAQWNARQLAQFAAQLLQQTPTLQFQSDRRDTILAWSDQHFPSPEALPKRLARLQFLGASAVQEGAHTAVLLRMKCEPRASLLILAHPMMKFQNLALQSANGGSFASWSEGHKTYVVLFHGSTTELKTYMELMGITT